MRIAARLRLFFLATLLAFLAYAALAALRLQSAPPAAAGSAASAAPSARAEFLRAADEVMAEMSRLVELPVKAPLQRSLRSRDEIQAFVLKEAREEARKDKWDADQKALERFGLLPRDFPLEKFLVELLTEQIAGLYDPKSREFYIADWVAREELRMVMAHELVHALQDQHFQIEKWTDAARPDDDAVLARHAVLEGSANLGMLEYLLREQGRHVRDLPDIGALLRAQMGAPEPGRDASSPALAKAPQYIRESLLFPYIDGASFAQAVLKKSGGWKEFNAVFEKPPVTTQQVMHPEKYFAGEVPEAVTLPDASHILQGGRARWRLLDDNIMGEFGVLALLKEHLSRPRSADLAAGWNGDRYAIYESTGESKGESPGEFGDTKQAGATKQTLLLWRLRLASEMHAARFFGGYSEALEKQHAQREGLLRRPNFFSFDTPEGGVFLYCYAGECFVQQGGTRALFDALVRQMKWPTAPRPPQRAGPRTHIARIPLTPQPLVAARLP